MENYLGEIRMFAGNFAPVGWAICDGSVMQISNYDTLYVLLGTTYGGDGVMTFALPDMRGRVPLHIGTGIGLPPVTQGQRAGAEKVTLTTANLPGHTHTLNCIGINGTVTDPKGNLMAIAVNNDPTKKADSAYVTDAASPAKVAMSAKSITGTGGSVPVEVVQPYVAINYIIATVGIFPSQG